MQAETSCKAVRADGEPCQMRPQANGWCWTHDPALARERAEARKLGGQNRRTPKIAVERGGALLRDVSAVLSLLEDTVADTLAQSNSAQRSRTLGYLAGLALKALEVGEIEERLAALERGAGAGGEQQGSARTRR